MEIHGNEEHGFVYSIDLPNNHLNIRVWGFWNLDLVEEFKKEIIQAIEELKGVSWKLLVDFSDFRAQRDAINEVFEEILVGATDNGLIRVAAVITSALTRLQVKRFAELSNEHNWSFHTNKEDAEQSLTEE